MNMKRAILAGSVGLALAAMASGAHAFSLGGYSGPINIKYSGYTTEDNLTPLSDETTWGAGFVTTFHEYGNPANVLWDNSGPEKISYFLYGMADANIRGSGPFDIYNVGCAGGACDGKIHLDLYLNPTGGAFNDTTAAGLQVSDRTSFSTMTGITDGVLLARFELVAGIETTDFPDGTNPLFDDRSAQMVQHVSATTLPATGDGSFYADCVAGPLCTGGSPDLNTDAIVVPGNPYNPSGKADILGQYTLKPVSATDPFGNPNPIWTNGWRGDTFDPVTAFVPEPGALALMGAGLVGLGAAARRRKTKA